MGRNPVGTRESPYPAAPITIRASRHIRALRATMPAMTLQRIVDGVERPEEPVALAWRYRGAQPQRALGGLQRGGIDGAEQRGRCDHQRELGEHLAREDRKSTRLN